MPTIKEMSPENLFDKTVNSEQFVLQIGRFILRPHYFDAHVFKTGDIVVYMAHKMGTCGIGRVHSVPRNSRNLGIRIWFRSGAEWSEMWSQVEEESVTAILVPVEAPPKKKMWRLYYEVPTFKDKKATGTIMVSDNIHEIAREHEILTYRARKCHTKYKYYIEEM